MLNDISVRESYNVILEKYKVNFSQVPKFREVQSISIANEPSGKFAGNCREVWRNVQSFANEAREKFQGNEQCKFREFPGLIQGTSES